MFRQTGKSWRKIKLELAMPLEIFSLSSIDTLSQLTLCWGERSCSMHCRMFSSILGLFPLDASNTRFHCLHCDNQKCLWTLTNLLWVRQYSVPPSPPHHLENHCSRFNYQFTRNSEDTRQEMHSTKSQHCGKFYKWLFFSANKLGEREKMIKRDLRGISTNYNVWNILDLDS